MFVADTQKKYAKVWRMHRGGDKAAAESDSEKGEHKSEGEGEKDVSCCVCDVVWPDIA